MWSFSLSKYCTVPQVTENIKNKTMDRRDYRCVCVYTHILLQYFVCLLPHLYLERGKKKKRWAAQLETKTTEHCVAEAQSAAYLLPYFATCYLDKELSHWVPIHRILPIKYFITNLDPQNCIIQFGLLNLYIRLGCECIPIISKTKIILKRKCLQPLMAVCSLKNMSHIVKIIPKSILQ